MQPPAQRLRADVSAGASGFRLEAVDAQAYSAMAYHLPQRIDGLHRLPPDMPQGE